MNILVTGATTPLGRSLVEKLHAMPEVGTIVAVGHEREAMPFHASPRLVYRDVDLTRHRAVHDLLFGLANDHAVDAVIHGAHHRSPTDVGAKVHAQNVDATHELLIECEKHPTIRRFVYRSFAEVYALRHATSDLIDEESPLDFDPSAPQWLRDRVEADLLTCSRFGGPLRIAVLRCAEILAADSGSQLWDYLQSRVCLRPLGFDPMINVLSIADATEAFIAALRSTARGVFNIAGADTLPLSRAIDESVRVGVQIPGPLMTPLYGLRRLAAGFQFRYDLNLRRFHFGGVVDGSRARDQLGYVPRMPVVWPRPWWRRLFDQLTTLN